MGLIIIIHRLQEFMEDLHSIMDMNRIPMDLCRIIMDLLRHHLILGHITIIVIIMMIVAFHTKISLNMLYIS